MYVVADDFSRPDHRSGLALIDPPYGECAFRPYGAMTMPVVDEWHDLLIEETGQPDWVMMCDGWANEPTCLFWGADLCELS